MHESVSINILFKNIFLIARPLLLGIYSVIIVVVSDCKYLQYKNYSRNFALQHVSATC